jgi:MtN3 and saliva related transmembrane protein
MIFLQTTISVDLQSAANHLGAARVQDLGYVAALFTTTAYVPQLVRVIRLRSARDISLPTFLLFAIGVFLWMLYGLYTASMPIILCNGVTLILAMSIVVLKLRYDRHKIEEIEP